MLEKSQKISLLEFIKNRKYCKFFLKNYITLLTSWAQVCVRKLEGNENPIRFKLVKQTH